MKTKIQTKIDDKWIILSSGEKQMRIKRNSKQGILLESCLNNPEGVDEDVLSYSLEHKKPVPTIKDHKKWLHDNEISDIKNIVQEQNRALTLLSNGKIYIKIEDRGMQMIVPENLRVGLGLLMDLFNPEDKEKRKALKGEKLQILNDFFVECGLDLKAVEKEGDNMEFTGSGTKQLGQFMKTCIGYKIDDLGLF